GVEQDARKESADEGADDAEDDVSDDPQAFVATNEEAGQITGNRAEDDPRNDAHPSTSTPFPVNGPAETGCGATVAVGRGRTGNVGADSRINGLAGRTSAGWTSAGGRDALHELGEAVRGRDQVIGSGARRREAGEHVRRTVAPDHPGEHRREDPLVGADPREDRAVPANRAVADVAPEDLAQLVL